MSTNHLSLGEENRGASHSGIPKMGNIAVPFKRTKVEKNFSALVKKVAGNAELRAQLLAAPTTIFLYDHNAPKLRRQREMVRREFFSLMKALLVAEGILPAESSDNEVEHYCFNKDRIVDYGCMYLSAVGSSGETNRGRVDDRISVKVLRKRAEALWWLALWFLLDEADSIYVAWKMKTEAIIYKVAVDCSLSVQKYPQDYLGVPELWLLLEAILTSFEPASWMKQHYAIWALVTMTGARPGSLTLLKDYEEQEMYLKWKDIRFLRFEGKTGIFLEVKLRWLKGQRDPHHRKASLYKGATFIINPCRNKTNLCADLTWILPLIAIDRGLFGDRTLDQLERSELFELDQDPEVTDQPVFLAGTQGNMGISDTETQPLQSGSLNEVLQRMTRRAGLPIRATVYGFRREFITAVSRNAGEDVARKFATHFKYDAYQAYDYGMGDMDVTEIRFGESKYANSGAARNELRMTLNSPAITKLHTPFNEEECKAHGIVSARSDITVIEFDDALRVILRAFCEKFDVPKAKIAIAFEKLHSLITLGSNDESSSEELGIPDHKENASEWEDMLSRVSTAQQAAKFLKCFLTARKTNRAWVYAEIKKEYIADWERSYQKPTLQQVSERKERVRNPVLLQKSAASVEKPASAEETQSIEETDRVRWDGRDISGDAFNSDELKDIEDVNEDIFDKIEDGARINAAGLDDAVAGPDLSATDEATEYLRARDLLIKRWNEYKDFEHGAVNCPLCLAHPWDPKIVKLNSAFKFDRHVCAPTGTHSPGAGKGAVIELYAQWCEDGNGRYICRLCQEDGAKERNYGEYSKLSKHLKKDHSEFCESIHM